MPFSVDIAAIDANRPVPASVPATAPQQAVAQQTAEQGTADAIGAVATGGTFDGLSLTYNNTSRVVSGVNTDKGSVAVAGHLLATDPHGDRAYADATFLPITGGTVLGDIVMGETPDRTVSLISGANARIVGTSYNNTGFAFFSGFRGRGSVSSPTGVQAGDVFLAITGAGHDGAALQEGARLSIAASETWTGTANGTSVTFLSTRPGTKGRVAFITLDEDTIINRPLRVLSSVKLGVNEGASGQVLTSQGPGATPTWTTPSGGGGGGGVTDHGALTGLADDDHPQYHNDARGDARYSALGHGHAIGDISGLATALSGKSDTSHTHADATPSVAGFMSAADKVKLNGVETGATADMTGAEIVSAIDTELGSSTWQGGGGGGAGPTTLRLSADVTTSSNAFIDVPGLQTTLSANTTYLVEGFILVQSSAAGTASPRVGWLFGTQVVWGTVNITADVSTAGVTVRTGNHASNENSRTGHVGNLATTTLATNLPSLVRVVAMFRTTATPSNVGITLAAEVTGATVVRVLADSTLRIQEVI